MDGSAVSEVTIDDLPDEVLTHVFRFLGFFDKIRAER